MGVADSSSLSAAAASSAALWGLVWRALDLVVLVGIMEDGGWMTGVPGSSSSSSVCSSVVGVDGVVGFAGGWRIFDLVLRVGWGTDVTASVSSLEDVISGRGGLLTRILDLVDLSGASVGV